MESSRPACQRPCIARYQQLALRIFKFLIVKLAILAVRSALDLNVVVRNIPSRGRRRVLADGQYVDPRLVIFVQRFACDSIVLCEYGAPEASSRMSSASSSDFTSFSSDAFCSLLISSLIIFSLQEFLACASTTCTLHLPCQTQVYTIRSFQSTDCVNLDACVELLGVHGVGYFFTS